MGATRLVPARLAFRDGVPFSEAYGDLYHSAQGGAAQARHVFLAGNSLPERWQGRSGFTILETGFGLGTNFLATLAAWRADPRRCRRLHFVSIEKHPLPAADLPAELRASWPMLVPGMHRIEFEGGVVLTLFFGDVVDAVKQLDLAADALYLDGFAPGKNPDMWSPQTIKGLARLAAEGATAATWSISPSVIFALENAGFSVTKREGFGSKKEMLACRFSRSGKPAHSSKNQKALVIGAGLAGAAVCERLVARGWEVTLLERHAGPAQEASGNHAGVFHPVVTPDDSVFARGTRAGFLYSLACWPRLGAMRWDPCGVLQLARNDKEERSQRASVETHAYPPEYAQWVDASEATRHAGVPLAANGLWFPRAGWVQPATLVQAQLKDVEVRFSNEISLLEKRGENWIAKSKDGKEIASTPHVVLATADDALHRVPHARLRRVRGQLTHLPAAGLDAPHVALLRGGFVLPAIDGVCVAGASFDIEDDDPQPRASSHEGNLERLGKIIQIQGKQFPSPQGRVAFRSVAPDRLPLVGKLDEGLYCTLAYGSRGLTWAALAGELLASRLEGEPLPLESSLAAAIDPGRFARRAERRRS